MLNAARVHGRPTMVIAIRIAAITQPTAIHRPPNTIHNMLSKSDNKDISYPSRVNADIDLQDPPPLTTPHLQHSSIRDCLVVRSNSPTRASSMGLKPRPLNNPVSYTHLRAHETRHDLVC